MPRLCALLAVLLLVAPLHADDKKKKKKKQPADPMKTISLRLFKEASATRYRKPELAIARYRQLLRLYPDSELAPRAAMNLMYVLIRNRRPQEALAVIRLGQRRYPEHYIGSVQAVQQAAQLAGFQFLPLHSIGIDEVNDGRFRLQPYGRDAVVQLYKIPALSDKAQLEGVTTTVVHTRNGTPHRALEAGWKRIGWHHFPARPAKGKQAVPPLVVSHWIDGPGSYVLVENVDGFRRVREFRVHSFGLFSRTVGQSVVLYVHDLRGAPMAGVRLRSIDDDKKVRQLGRSGADGMLRLTLKGDHHVVPDHEGAYEELDLEGAPLERGPYRVHIKTDRPVYRPGQRVQFRALVRKETDGRLSSVPAGTRVMYSLADPRGRHVVRRTTTVDADGVLTGEMQLAPEPPLGEWSVVVHLAGGPSGWQWDAPRDGFWRQSFEVLSYRKPQMDVRVQFVAQKQTEEGLRISARISAEYLFGGPVAHGRVDWTALGHREWSWSDREASRGNAMRPPMRDPLAWHYQGRPDLVGRWSETWVDKDEVAVRQGVLDAKGQLLVHFDVKVDEEGRGARNIFHHWFDRYSVEAIVRDSTRLTAEGSASIAAKTSRKPRDILHTFPAGQYFRPGQKIPVDLRLRSSTGAARKGETVRLVLTQKLGGKKKDNRPDWDPLAIASATCDAAGEARATLTIPAETRGWVTLIARSRHGSDHVRLRVVDDRALPAPVAPADVEFPLNGEGPEPLLWIAPERPCYRGGERMRLLVHAGNHPSARHALLTVEGATIHVAKLLTLSKRDEIIELPLPASYAPNVFVTLTVLDQEWPTTAACEVFVAPTASRVQVQLRPGAPVKGPREAQTLKVITTIDGKPVPARVSLGVVDEAIYKIAAENTPAVGWHMRPLYQDDGESNGTISYEDPEPRSYRDWELSLGDQRPSSGGGTTGAVFDTGEDEESGPADSKVRAPVADEPDVRRYFPDTLLWRTDVRTGKDGTATLALNTPDSLTRWRVMAYGQAAQAFGQGRAEFRTTAPVICRLAAPRFFVDGDRSTLAVVVHNRTKKAATFRVAMKVGGAKLVGKAGREIEIAAGGDGRVDFPIQIDGSGPVSLEASVRSAVGSDAMATRVPVRRFGVMDFRAARSGVVAPEWKATLGLPDSYDGGSAELEIFVGGSPMEAVRQALPYLVAYPYGCVEQTMSRFLPAVVARRAIAKLGLKVELAVPLDDAINRGLQRLYGFQHTDGGWGWWKHDQTNARMTAYVTYGLALAREAGVDVSQKVLDAARQVVGYNEDAFSLLAHAAIGDAKKTETQGAQIEVDEADPIAERLADAVKELEKLAKADRDSDVALTAAMLVLAGRKELVGKLRTTPPKQRRWRSVRHVGWTMRALVSVNPEHPAIPRLRDWLLDARYGPRWNTTLDTAHAVLALVTQLVADAPRRAKVKVTLNGAELPLKDGRVRVTGDRLVKGDNQIVVRKLSGDEVLRASAMLRFHAAPEKKGRTHGVSVTRRLERLDRSKPLPDDWYDRGGADDPRWTPLAGKPIRVGDTLRVVVEVDVPANVTSAEYLLIEAPIPAGTEPVLRQPKRGWWDDSWYQHKEARDNRIIIAAREVHRCERFTFQLRATAPGRYRVLPAEAWNMYDTSQRGYSPATEVRIIDAEGEK